MFGGNVLIGIGGGGIMAPLVSVAVADSMGWTACFFVLALGAVAGVIISLALPKFKLQK